MPEQNAIDEAGPNGVDRATGVQAELGELLRPVGSPRPHPSVLRSRPVSQHLLLSGNALLVPLPPGRVVQVAKRLVSSCDP